MWQFIFSYCTRHSLRSLSHIHFFKVDCREVLTVAFKCMVRLVELGALKYTTIILIILY